MHMRKRLWEIVEVAREGDKPSRLFDGFLLILILLNVLAAILETVASMHQSFMHVFGAFERFSVAVFTLEYAARLWSCVEDSRYRRPVVGRVRFAVRFMSIVDLLAFLPFYLPFLGADLRAMRMLRMFRILRVLKLGRYYASLHLIGSVCKSKKEELVMTSAFMVLLLVISSSLMFYCEHAVQPEAFPHIPATMWWAVATLTTVGYGDVYPVTPLGRIFASIIAVLGIGMFALPTGILGSGFVEELQKKRENGRKVCPHCGKPID